MFGYSWEDDPQKTKPSPVAKPPEGAAPTSGTTPNGATSFASPRNTGIAGGLQLGMPELSGGTQAQPAGQPPPTGGPDFSQLGLGAGAGASQQKPQPQPVGAADLSQVGGQQARAPQRGTMGARTGPGGAQDLNALSDKVKNLATIADPAERARVQDEVARSVAQSLQGAGHTVKWQGDTLMVDGRPYVVGGSAQPAQAGGPADARGAAGRPVGAATQPPGAPVDPNQQYDPNEAMNQVIVAFRARFNRDLTPQEQQALLQAVGYGGGPVPGTMLQQALDFVSRYSGNLDDPWGAGGGPGGGGGGQEPPPGSGTPEWRAQWEYTPGEITFDDLDGFDQPSILQQLGPALQPGNTRADAATDDLVMSILQNPESMSPEVVAAMKARSKDELAEMGRMEEDALRNFGFDTGITDSNWLRSEQLAATRERQNALVGKNRDIEIDAAKTNAEDRRNAAGLGMEFSDRRFGQVLASKQEQRQAVQLAADTGLRAAAVRGDRMALREQINAKAAELGLEADKVALQYTLGLMDDLTKRYGIDVGKEVDLKKLAEQGRQFNEDLALRFAQLEFQYAELAKRDEWAQLDAGVRLAGYGYSGADGYDPDLSDGRTDPRDKNRNGIPDNEE